VRPGWRKLRSVWAAIVAARRDRRRKAGGLDRADAARRAFDWPLVVDLYASYLKRHPNDLGVRLRLVRALTSSARFDEAVAQLEQARRDRPDRTDLANVAAELEAARTASTPLADYDRFRRTTEPPAAPPGGAGRIVSAVIDGRGQSPALIALTREGLAKSGSLSGPVVVLTDDEDFGALAAMPTDGLALMLDAGVVVDAATIDWLGHALSVTGAVAAYADDDRAEMLQGGATVFSDPAFHSTPHPLDLATTPRVPAAILVEGSVLGKALAPPPEAMDRRKLLASAFSWGKVAHVPLVLATDWGAPKTKPAPVSDHDGAGAARIQVVIPTRDEGAVLSVMIESLFATAARPEDMDLVIVDNGSRDPGTISFLAMLERKGSIRVLPADEPFNWSRLNNLAAAGAEAEILVFANNDMQMLTQGWDDRLRHHLSRPGVAVAGARLIYPNGRLQHAGVTLGAVGNHLIHEGLGALPSEAGPLSRWRRDRPAAAVTGAFMGVRRGAFERAGGFNEAFAVGCNDIDFCLRIRSQGGTILYAADLELTHAESLSRGHDDTEVRMRRADGERAALFRIWGEDAGRDPGRNPHWVSHETLLYHGIRKPHPLEVERWIRRSVDLWAVVDDDGHSPVESVSCSVPSSSGSGLA